MVLVAGTDEAGRGCVMGPLVICVAVIEKEKEAELKAIGARDSKLLTPGQRKSLYKKIKSLCKESKCIHITAGELNELMPHHSLNEIEAMKIAELFDKMKAEPEQMVVDSPDNNVHMFEKRLMRHAKKKTDFLCEHKADAKHPIVSAASIIAKVERDSEIDRIKGELGHDFNSGYSSDPKTIVFLRANIDRPEVKKYVRMRWSTVDKLRQRKLSDF